MHLVDQAGGQELAHRRYPSADAHIKVTSQLACHVESLGWSLVDEVESRAALHLEWRPPVGREHHDGAGEERGVFPSPLSGGAAWGGGAAPGGVWDGGCWPPPTPATPRLSRGRAGSRTCCAP